MIRLYLQPKLIKKMETKHTFKNKNYSLSTDYDLLWELVQKGNRLASWIVYTDGFGEPIWDLVEVRKRKTDDTLMIGCRGINYYDDDDKLSFVTTCIQYSLHFILPND